MPAISDISRESAPSRGKARGADLVCQINTRNAAHVHDNSRLRKAG